MSRLEEPRGFGAWLQPPPREDPDEALRARVTHWVLIAGMVTLGALLLALPVYQRDPYTLPVFGGSLVFILVAFVLLHRGHLWAAGLLACSMGWAIVMAVSFTSGGVQSPQLATMVLIVMLIGFLWTSRAAIVAAMVTSLSILGLIVAGERGLLPETGPDPEPTAVWGATTSVLVIAAVFLHQALRAMDAARREASEKSRQLEEEMERRAQAEESLRRAQRLEALGRLSGGIAHDFNNILTVLMAQSALLQDEARAGGRFDENARVQLADIQASAERASLLTRRLLGFARPAAGRPRTLEPRATLMRLEPVLRRVIPENIRLEIPPSEPGLAVSIDPDQLEQVLLNLVLNARDAMPSGGTLRVEVSRRAADAAPAAGPDGGRGWVRLAVSDTGAGIAPEDRDRIFDPFFTTKDLGHGTGLGLSTVHGIVTQAGGTIEVESAPDRGTTLRVELPAVEPEAEGPASSRTPDTMGGSGTVLVCEDEAPVRAVLESVLTRAGYQVLAADRPERAIELARDRAVDLLVTDVVMPGMSGPALARTLRAELGDLPVLLVTGYAAEEVMPDGTEERTELLEKPFTPAALGAAVERLLARGGRPAAP